MMNVTLTSCQGTVAPRYLKKHKSARINQRETELVSTIVVLRNDIETIEKSVDNCYKSVVELRLLLYSPEVERSLCVRICGVQSPSCDVYPRCAISGNALYACFSRDYMMKERLGRTPNAAQTRVRCMRLWCRGWFAAVARHSRTSLPCAKQRRGRKWLMISSRSALLSLSVLEYAHSLQSQTITKSRPQTFIAALSSGRLTRD